MLIHPSSPVEPYDPEPADVPTPDEYAPDPFEDFGPNADKDPSGYRPLSSPIPADAPF